MSDKVADIIAGYDPERRLKSFTIRLVDINEVFRKRVERFLHVRAVCCQTDQLNKRPYVTTDVDVNPSCRTETLTAAGFLIGPSSRGRGMTNLAGTHQFRCPYHGGTYALDGQRKERPTSPELRLDRQGWTIPVETAVWRRGSCEWPRHGASDRSGARSVAQIDRLS